MHDAAGSHISTSRSASGASACWLLACGVVRGKDRPRQKGTSAYPTARALSLWPAPGRSRRLGCLQACHPLRTAHAAHSPLKVLALRGQHNLAVVVPADRGVVGQAPAVRVHLRRAGRPSREGRPESESRPADRDPEWQRSTHLPRQGRPEREGRLADLDPDRERRAQQQVMCGKQEP